MTSEAINRALQESQSFTHRQTLLKELWRMEESAEEVEEAENEKRTPKMATVKASANTTEE